MEWVTAITAFILGILRIFKSHMLVMVANHCKQIEEIRIKTKRGETTISKIKSNQNEINHQDSPDDRKLLSK